MPFEFEEVARRENVWPDWAISFVAKIGFDSPENCWLWLAGKLSSGYGCFAIGGRTIGAHRAAALLWLGPLGEGIQVLHRCDVRRCVNPHHLFLGTHADNMADRRAKAGYPSGVAHHNAKLTTEQVEEIKTRGQRGEPQRRIAAEYGVTQPVVGRILRGTSYREETWNRAV